MYSRAIIVLRCIPRLGHAIRLSRCIPLFRCAIDLSWCVPLLGCAIIPSVSSFLSSHILWLCDLGLLSFVHLPLRRVAKLPLTQPVVWQFVCCHSSYSWWSLWWFLLHFSFVDLCDLLPLANALHPRIIPSCLKFVVPFYMKLWAYQSCLRCEHERNRTCMFVWYTQIDAKSQLLHPFVCLSVLIL